MQQIGLTTQSYSKFFVRWHNAQIDNDSILLKWKKCILSNPKFLLDIIEQLLDYRKAYMKTKNSEKMDTFSEIQKYISSIWKKATSGKLKIDEQTTIIAVVTIIQLAQEAMKTQIEQYCSKIM